LVYFNLKATLTWPLLSQVLVKFFNALVLELFALGLALCVIYFLLLNQPLRDSFQSFTKDLDDSFLGQYEVCDHYIFTFWIFWWFELCLLEEIVFDDISKPFLLFLFFCSFLTLWCFCGFCWRLASFSGLCCLVCGLWSCLLFHLVSILIVLLFLCWSWLHQFLCNISH